MRWDQICLRIMLWSLAATALAGVTAIFAFNEILAALLETGATTAAAAGLMWPLTRVAERPEKRLAGLVGMVAVLVEFLLLLVLIWNNTVARPIAIEFRDKIIDFFAWAAVWLPLTALPAFVFLHFWDHPAGWLTARVGAIASGAVFGQLMLAHVGSRGLFFGRADSSWSQAAAATAIYGLLAAICLAGTLRQRPWRWAGVAGAIVAWVMMTADAIQHTESKVGAVVFTFMTTLAVVAAYSNLFSLPSLNPRHELVRQITFGLALLTAVFTDIMIMREIVTNRSGDEITDFLGRLAAASGIPAACGSVAIVILALLNRRSVRAAVEPFVAMSWVEMSIVCPACGRQQTVPLGESACAQCRLRFSIRISERPV